MRLILSFLTIILLFNCNENSPNYAKDSSGLLGITNAYGNDELFEINESTIESAVELNYNYNQTQKVVAPQKIIKESYLQFETKDLDKAYNNILRYVKQNKGFIQNDNATKNYNRSSRSLIVRVPTKGFQTTIDSISKSVEFFDTKRISAKDVTEEFIDLEARLKAKKTLEERYLQLLTKAKNVKEMLEIERELSNIREEIEAKQGRLKYLTDKVSLSTINIEFYKTTVESRATRSYGSKMWRAIQSGFNGVSVFFLGILNIWPLIIALLIGVSFLRKWLKKRRKK